MSNWDRGPSESSQEPQVCRNPAAVFSVHHKYLPPWQCRTLGACVGKSHHWESDQDTPGVHALTRKHSLCLSYVQDTVLRAIKAG